MKYKKLQINVHLNIESSPVEVFDNYYSTHQIDVCLRHGSAYSLPMASVSRHQVWVCHV